MNSIIRSTLFEGWHTMRWVALFIGIFMATMAIWYQDILTGFLSAFFFFQAVTNSGCLGAQSCNVPLEKDPGHYKESEINYTEVK